MHVISVDLPRELRRLTIIPIADTHLGDPHADEELLRNRIEYIRTHDDVYTILCGDILNNATRSGVSDVYGERYSPMGAIQRAVELFRPIAHKIIGIVDGNHEARTLKDSGICLGQIIAAELGLSDKYCSEGLFIFLRFGQSRSGVYESNGSGKRRRMCYTIYVTHGNGGGKRAGGKLNALEELAGIVDADVYISGHVHLPGNFKECFYRVDARNSMIMNVEKTFVSLSAYLKYGGYGQRMGFKPASLSAPMIAFDGTRKNVEVTT